MKTKSFIAVIMTLALTFASCGSTSTSSNPLAALSAQSAAYTSGQSAGTALRALYTQYKTNGKIDMTNLATLTHILTLTNSCQTLKNAQKGTGAYADFTKGLMMGSNNLVNQTNTETVVSNLTNVINKVDTSSLTNAINQGSNKVNTAVNTAVEKGNAAIENATAKGSAVVENASSIANSITSIVNLFK